MKTLFKRLLPAALALCLVLTGCGGGGQESAATLNPADTAQALLDAGVFEGALDTVDLEAACTLYGITFSDVQEGVVYCSLSAGAEEIAIFRMADADAAKAALAGLEQRVSDQTAALKDYQPQEVSKLESAIVTQVGDCAVLVVAADAQGAQSVLDGGK